MNDTIVRYGRLMHLVFWTIGAAVAAAIMLPSPYLFNATPTTGDPLFVIHLFAGLVGGYMVFFRYNYASERRYLTILNHVFTGACMGALTIGYIYCTHEYANYALFMYTASAVFSFFTQERTVTSSTANN